MVALTRRSILKSALASGIGGIAMPAVFTSARGADKTLTVTHFGGPYKALDDIVAAPFEKAGLGHVNYDVAFSGAAVGKLQTQKEDPPFDVTMISRSFAIRAQNGGLLTKIDKASIKEASNLVDGALPEAGWGVAMVLDTFDYMVDEKQIKEPMTSWLDLWRPDLKGKVMLPAASNPATVFFIACIAKSVGGDMSAKAIDEAFVKMKALKPSVRSFYSDASQPTQLIERGEIAAAPQFGIRIANQTKKIPNVVKVTPKEGVVAIPYDLCIPVNSKNKDLAKTYIDFTLRKDIQSSLVTNLLATPARKDVDIAADIKPLVTTDFDKIWFADEQEMAAKQKEWLDRYTREIQS